MKALALALFLAAPAFGAGTSYVIDPAQCQVAIHVGKSGVFSFAGHEHHVVAPELTGKIVASPEDIGSSSVQVTFQSKALKVLEKGEPEGDAAKTQTVMLSPQVLDVVQFPEISFASKTVAGKEAQKGTWNVDVSGELSLHGLKKAFTVPVKVTIAGDTLTASGRFTVRQTDFHMSPVSVAGVVKVKDEVAIEFTLVARAEP